MSQLIPSNRTYLSHRSLKVLIGIFLFWGLVGCSVSSVQPTTRSVAIKPTIPDEIISPSTSVIRLANGDWVPFAGENLPGYGCDSHVVTEAFSQAGYSVKFGFFTWARAIRLAEIGEWDGTLEWADTPEHRSSFYISSEPLSEQEWVFFYRADQPFQWQSLDDLKDKKVGITRGYTYSDLLNDYIKTKKIIIEEATNDEANFKKLIAGRIDIFPMEKTVGMAMLNQLFSQEERDAIRFHNKPLGIFQPHLLLAKTNPENSLRMGSLMRL